MKEMHKSREIAIIARRRIADGALGLYAPFYGEDKTRAEADAHEEYMVPKGLRENEWINSLLPAYRRCDKIENSLIRRYR